MVLILFSDKVDLESSHLPLTWPGTCRHFFGAHLKNLEGQVNLILREKHSLKWKEQEAPEGDMEEAGLDLDEEKPASLLSCP